MLSAILLPPLCSAAVSLLQMAVMMIAKAGDRISVGRLPVYGFRVFLFSPC